MIVGLICSVKNPGPKDTALSCPWGALGVFIFARRLWSNGVVESMKSQFPSIKPGPRPEGGDSEGEIPGFSVKVSASMFFS